MKRKVAPLLFLCLLNLPARAGDAVAGWRGNWTGLWPEARSPLEWSRIPRGVLSELRYQAAKPGAKAQAAPLIADGLVRDWLALGPFPTADSVRDFDQAQFPGEATVDPDTGDKVGALAWKPLAVRADDPTAFGEVHLAWADLAAALGGYKPNQVAYAHTYLYTPKGGTVRAVVDHAHGLKAWLNGKVVYRSSERGIGLGNYVSLSRFEFSLTHAASPRFDLELKPGWNRLLFKVSAYNKSGWEEQRFALRLMDLPNIPYESKNILWMTELPHRSNATPLVVGGRLFVMAEPDELLCLDARTGRLLWSAANNFYEALTPEERRAKPAFREKIDPLIEDLKKEKDFVRRVGLRGKIHKELLAIDAERFGFKADGHFQDHFGIVGFTTPTPVSDGKHVWVWCGNGVAACYDLDGQRQWITRIEAGPLSYSSSPALIDGTLAVFLNKLFGLDAATGKVRWEQPQIRGNNGSLLAARLAGVPVVLTDSGTVVRVSDGKVLFRDRNHGATWAPGVVLGDLLYLPNYGVSELQVLDFKGATGEDWKPRRESIVLPEEIHRGVGGKWIDRMTAGSPLVHEGLAYTVDIYASFYAIDLKARKMLYRQETDLHGLFHYNSLPVAASVTLLGEHLVIQDNQGTALVLKPGRTFQQAARNRLATQLDRPWPIPAQETIAYGPPVADGNRFYLRGERYLYCIGEK